MHIYLILVWLIGLAASCPPPMGDMQFLSGNGTHDGETVMMDTYKRLLSSPNGQGWADVVSNALQHRTTWPDGLIEWCFNDYNIEEKIWAELDEAWKIWLNAIGRPGGDTGHNLQFKEVSYTGSHKYCTLLEIDANGKFHERWNPEVRKDALVIKWLRVPGMYMSSELGYKKEEWDNKEQRHVLNINMWELPGDRNIVIKDLAHEIGHVMGLYHEHQRPDRDHYAHFTCSNLHGYEEAVRQLQNPFEPWHDVNAMCNNPTVGPLYGFRVMTQFTNQPIREPSSKPGDNNNFLIPNYNFKYDTNSIMHYDSWMQANRDKDLSQELNVPLTLWKKRGEHFDGPASPQKEDLDWIQTSDISKPSPEDIKRVVELYPWKG